MNTVINAKSAFMVGLDTCELDAEVFKAVLGATFDVLKDLGEDVTQIIERVDIQPAKHLWKRCVAFKMGLRIPEIGNMPEYRFESETFYLDFTPGPEQLMILHVKEQTMIRFTQILRKIAGGHVSLAHQRADMMQHISLRLHEISNALKALGKSSPAYA